MLYVGLTKKAKSVSKCNALTPVACLNRPNDSRMLVALGESYEKLTQQLEAKKVRTLQLSPNPGLCNNITKLSVSDIFYLLSSVTGGHTLLEM